MALRSRGWEGKPENQLKAQTSQCLALRLLSSSSVLFSLLHPPPPHPFPGSWRVRLTGTVEVVKASTPKSSRDRHFATSLRNQLHFAFYAPEICVLQPSSLAHLGLSPPWDSPSDALVSRMTPQEEVLIESMSFSETYKPKGSQD